MIRAKLLAFLQSLEIIFISLTTVVSHLLAGFSDWIEKINLLKNIKVSSWMMLYESENRTDVKVIPLELTGHGIPGSGGSVHTAT